MDKPEAIESAEGSAWWFADADAWAEALAEWDASEPTTVYERK